MRLSGLWQRGIDDRILELLDEESWSTPSVMKLEPYIHATENQIRDRCMVLADADLLAVDQTNGWEVELTTEGKLYLEGETDVGLHSSPRSARSLERFNGRC